MKRPGEKGESTEESVLMAPLLPTQLGEPPAAGFEMLPQIHHKAAAAVPCLCYICLEVGENTSLEDLHVESHTQCKHETDPNDHSAFHTGDTVGKSCR